MTACSWREGFPAVSHLAAEQRMPESERVFYKGAVVAVEHAGVAARLSLEQAVWCHLVAANESGADGVVVQQGKGRFYYNLEAFGSKGE